MTRIKVDTNEIERLERELREAGYYAANDGFNHFHLYYTTDSKPWRKPGLKQWWFSHEEAVRFGHRVLVQGASR